MKKKSHNEKPKFVVLVFWEPVAALHSFQGFLGHSNNEASKFERPCNFLGPWGKIERN